MHKTLDVLIESFRAAQDIGVSTLVNKLGVPQPKTALEWVFVSSDHGLRGAKVLQGVGIRVHGIGIELTIGTMTIDFDWGSNGEPDGFDGWRLYIFALNNLPEIKCSHSEVNEWLRAALADDELIKAEEGDLYYDPKRRSALRPDRNRC